jgi:hypothetical protein
MSAISETIFAMLAEAGPGKTIDPSSVAKAVDPVGWRRLLSKVRNEAIFLARQEQLVITRHNKPADPDAFKGVYRLRLP